MSDLYYVQKLNDVLEARKSSNPKYSLRAFARDLDLDSASLSQIIRGKRKLPLRSVKEVANKIDLTPLEKSLFLESFFKKDLNLLGSEILDPRFELDESYYEIIAEWEYYAALELFSLDDLKEFSAETVSYSLNIDLTRAQEVIENLLKVELISKDEDGKYIQTHNDVKTSDGIESAALMVSHLEGLDIAKEKIREFDLDQRDFSSCSFAIDPDRLPELKELIREFRKKISAFSKVGNKTEVYQTSIQLFPLTDLNRRNKQ